MESKGDGKEGFVGLDTKPQKNKVVTNEAFYLPEVT